MYLFQQHGDWFGLLPRYWYTLWSEKSCDPFCYCPCVSGDGKENRSYTKPISITDTHPQPFGLVSFKSNWLYGDNLRTAECIKHTNTQKVFLDEEISLSVLTCLLSGPRVEVTAAFKDAELTQTGGFPPRRKHKRKPLCFSTNTRQLYPPSLGCSQKASKLSPCLNQCLLENECLEKPCQCVPVLFFDIFITSMESYYILSKLKVLNLLS